MLAGSSATPILMGFHQFVWRRFTSADWLTIYFSQTTPSPLPSRALGTIDFGKPLPPPLLPCTRRSPAACVASRRLPSVMATRRIFDRGVLWLGCRRRRRHGARSPPRGRGCGRSLVV